MFNISRERLHSGKEYSALDRNFLSWARTSVSLLVFGLGVEKFGIFVESLSGSFVGNYARLANNPNPGSYSEREGIIIMIMGALVGLFGFVQYLMRLKHMDDKIYISTHISALMITVAVILTALLFLSNLFRL
ncbi:MAG: DUF202 domain-containing protein [Nitrospirae bacterium]|nr:DUF202 domain-containing protein [Nitrospirota bacterium]